VPLGHDIIFLWGYSVLLSTYYATFFIIAKGAHRYFAHSTFNCGYYYITKRIYPHNLHNQPDSDPRPFYYQPDNDPGPFYHYHRPDSDPCPFYHGPDGDPRPFYHYHGPDSDPCPFYHYHGPNSNPCPFNQWSNSSYYSYNANFD
jgi:hypothetical protein